MTKVDEFFELFEKYHDEAFKSAGDGASVLVQFQAGARDKLMAAFEAAKAELPAVSEGTKAEEPPVPVTELPAAEEIEAAPAPDQGDLNA